jgi:beta-glucanase (GH16 family)
MLWLISNFSCHKADSKPAPPQTTLPVLVILDIAQVRDNAVTTNYRFFVNVTGNAPRAITVDYTTVAGTALANTDFKPVSGTLTVAAGQTVGYIDVPVTGDSLRQNDQYFYVQLNNAANATINGTGKATGTIQNLGTYLPVDGTGYTTPTSYPGYTLAWSDEFSGKTIDNTAWNFEIGGSGWGNHELEYYTSDTKNSFLSNGYLIIEARKETIGSNNYTSARMTTAGKKQFQYGRVDIRAKIPVATGMWPALWMLGANISQVGWPACGETDIMELIGKNPKQVIGSIHWAQQNGSSGTINNSYSLSAGDFSQQFHVYSLIWKQDSIRMLVDDRPYMSAARQDITSGTWPFNNPSFFIFNVAVGGDWPGPPDNTTTVFPQRMYVDYIRVFQ